MIGNVGNQMREAKGVVLLKRPQHEMRQQNCDCDNGDTGTTFPEIQPSPPEALVAVVDAQK